jgi:hypothetical protein
LVFYREVFLVGSTDRVLWFLPEDLVGFIQIEGPFLFQDHLVFRQTRATVSRSDFIRLKAGCWRRNRWLGHLLVAPSLPPSSSQNPELQLVILK